MIKIVNFNYLIPEDAIAVNTTSRSNNWSIGLSPFFLGPVSLYGNYTSKNMENAWQYSKLYYDHADEFGNPTSLYFDWAIDGWATQRANRYPMGRGTKPLCSYWDGEKLSYIEARRKIYIPLYSKAVAKTSAFAKLQSLYQSCLSDNKVLYLIDFDAHSLTPSSFKYDDLWNNDKIKVGHAYVLAMMLERFL